MDEFWWRVGIVFMAMAGATFSTMIWIWQLITNMFGFWFWFSLASCVGWGMLCAILNDIDFINSETIRFAKGEEKRT